MSYEIERLPRELPRDLPELQIVEIPQDREVDRTPPAVIIRPPIDRHGNFRYW